MSQTLGVQAGRVTKAKKIKPQASSPEEPWASARLPQKPTKRSISGAVGEVSPADDASQWSESAREVARRSGIEENMLAIRLAVRFMKV